MRYIVLLFKVICKFPKHVTSGFLWPTKCAKMYLRPGPRSSLKRWHSPDPLSWGGDTPPITDAYIGAFGDDPLPRPYTPSQTSTTVTGLNNVGMWWPSDTEGTVLTTETVVHTVTHWITESPSQFTPPRHKTR